MLLKDVRFNIFLRIRKEKESPRSVASAAISQLTSFSMASPCPHLSLEHEAQPCPRTFAPASSSPRSPPSSDLHTAGSSALFRSLCIFLAKAAPSPARQNSVPLVIFLTVHLPPYVMTVTPSACHSQLVLNSKRKETLVSDVTTSLQAHRRHSVIFVE